METRWLHDFITLAELNSFTRAAEVRHSSQAAFSRRIRALEAWLGTELIDRSVFPTKLTEEGERFLDHAISLIQRLSDARSDVSGPPSGYRTRVRIAAPHALATAMLPGWWREWTHGMPTVGYSVNPANVHDAVTSFVSGHTDLLVCFHNPQQPVHLDLSRYSRLTVCTQMLKPYASPDALAQHPRAFSDTTRSLPILAYSPGAYLGRMVDLIIESAAKPLRMVNYAESDMADVLREMAVAGYGIAWLPDCVAERALKAGQLTLACNDPRWALKLSIVVYKDTSNMQPALERLWKTLSGLYPNNHIG